MGGQNVQWENPVHPTAELLIYRTFDGRLLRGLED